MNKLKELIKKGQVKQATIVAIGANFIFPYIVYADAIDNIAVTLSSYAQKGGAFATFVGALMAVMGYKNSEPSKMFDGIKTVIAGAATIAVATGYKAYIQ